ncbi:hypothetical protein, partial [Enterobacter hormaechei]|uniref:hypothetical protein n=1 Tax=Enterobacter hormaechei TaxID=158836 RepID=UPI0019531882
ISRKAIFRTAWQPLGCWALRLFIRSPDEFTVKIIAPSGAPELATRAGHIPGTVNVPRARAVNAADRTIKSVEELRRLYA